MTDKSWVDNIALLGEVTLALVLMLSFSRKQKTLGNLLHLDVAGFGVESAFFLDLPFLLLSA
jgi:hypothetical protein